jgi:hypothetical protein
MELWKPIKKYEGLYEISNMGKIRRVRFTNNIVSKEKIYELKPQKHNNRLFAYSFMEKRKAKGVLNT